MQGTWAVVFCKEFLLIVACEFTAPADDKSGLTLEALSKHDIVFNRLEKENADPTINEIATSLKSYQISEDDDMSQLHSGLTFKSHRTFASDYSACTNMSFSK